MVGWMPCFSQISLIGSCSKRCSRRIFAFSSGLYRLRCFLFILLFLGRGKVAYFKSLKRTFQVKQNTNMAAKGIKYVEIDVAQNTAFPLNEAAEMGGGSNVSNGAGRRVSVAFEVICERIDVWSTDSNAQAPQRLGREETLF